MENNLFLESLEKMNIHLTEVQKEQLETYYTLLVEWNQKMNLTGITEKKDVYLKHFYDSATICHIINLNDVQSLCDIGTGAGFPGMVLKILFPKLEVTLIDSLHKRIQFLQFVSKSLSLKKITIIESRAEDYAKSHREKFDVVTSRAVAPLPILMEYSVPLVKEQGHFIPMKAKVEEELKQIHTAIQALHVTLEDELYFLLPIENSQRSLLKFRKNKVTNIKYPRKYSEIKKHPL